MLGRIDKRIVVSKKEVKKNYLIYSSLILVLIVALFLRIYRVGNLLGFWYDQGRDALVIWDLWHKGKFFLIGPTTGIEGVFRGPWYYWLIAPFYLLGKGSPIYPAVFLALTSAFAIFVLYFLGTKIADRQAGLIAAFIAALSYYIISASRWLSNPTPMLLIGVLFLWSLYKIVEEKTWAWFLATFLIGMAIQFGSAAEIFYLPGALIFIYWQRKNLPSRKVILGSLLIFLLTFLPQILFDVKHQGVLLLALKKFLLEDKGFQLSVWNIVSIRFSFYYNLIISKLWVEEKILVLPFILIFAYQFLLKRAKYLANPHFKILVLFVVMPIVGLMFFQGNKGVIYDYYFTGYYLFFILFFAILIRDLAKNPLGKIVVFIFFVVFSSLNLKTLNRYLSDSGLDDKKVIYSDQLAAIDWIYKDSGGEKFNIDVYVPPVIPYAYDYLFLWYGTSRCGENLCGLEKNKNIPLFYTLSEYDLEYPTRVNPWAERQDTIGKVESEVRFGGIFGSKKN